MLPTILHPKFIFRGLDDYNKDNIYIIKEVSWFKDRTTPTPINKLLASVEALGFIPINEDYEANDNTYVHQVAVMNHPSTGEMHIGIVGGPDFDVIKALYEPLDKIIEEKAQFKLNVHPVHITEQ